jgi:hypothetical protein
MAAAARAPVNFPSPFTPLYPRRRTTTSCGRRSQTSRCRGQTSTGEAAGRHARRGPQRRRARPPSSAPRRTRGPSRPRPGPRKVWRGPRCGPRADPLPSPLQRARPRPRLLAERGKLKGVLDSVASAREGLERRAYDQEVQARPRGGKGGPLWGGAGQGHAPPIRRLRLGAAGRMGGAARSRLRGRSPGCSRWSRAKWSGRRATARLQPPDQRPSLSLRSRGRVRALAPPLAALAAGQVECSLKDLEESVRQYNLAAHRRVMDMR